MSMVCPKCRYAAPPTKAGYGAECPKCGAPYPSPDPAAPSPAMIANPNLPPVVQRVSRPADADTPSFAILIAVVCYIVSGLAFFNALYATALGTSAIHQILAAIYWLTFVLALAAGAAVQLLGRRARAPSA